MTTVDFKNAEKRQTLKGFGTSACWWSQNVSREDTAQELSELLYGKSGLGLNIYRYNVGGGWDKDNCRVENPWRRCESFYIDLNADENEGYKGEYDFSRDKNAYSFMKRCLEKGLIDTVILFANSPHYSFTSSGQASGSLMHHTCNLPMCNYERFADYFLDITEHFIADGIPVTYISPINEPQWKWGGKNVWQEGCHYEPEEVAAVMHIFAKKLEERKLDNIYLYGPESGEIEGLTEKYLELFLKDELIMKHLGVFGVHSYHSDRDAEIRRRFYNNTVLKHANIRFDMSEWCELPCVSDTESINGALNTARVMGWDLCEMGAESWTSWVAVNQIGDSNDEGKDYSDGLLSATDGFSVYRICKRYYAMKHFTDFLPKGSSVLYSKTDIDDKLNVFMFERPDGKKVLIAVNEGKARDINVNCDEKKAVIFSTTQKRNFKKDFDGEHGGVIHLKAKSLTTVCFE